ncbi:MAG TPA: class I SAM-dependent methyltransferase [Bdellovibrionota bacterium]|nr:class I SAM-dependent methyltransferase [Bdellovibrionota bacterium]
MAEPKFANTALEKRLEAQIYRDYYTPSMFEWWLRHPYRRHTLAPFSRYLKSLAGKDSTVVEFASGAGVNLTLLKEAFPRLNCFGFDISADGARVAKNLGKGSYWVGDAEEAAVRSGIADAVVLVSVVHHFWRNPEKLMNEVGRILKPGGFVLVLDPAADRRESFLTKAITYLGMGLVVLDNRMKRGRVYEVEIPESDTEQPLSSVKLLQLLSSWYPVLDSGRWEWVTYLARHHEAGFHWARIADLLIRRIDPRQLNLCYAIARKPLDSKD